MEANEDFSSREVARAADLDGCQRAVTPDPEGVVERVALSTNGKSSVVADEHDEVLRVVVAHFQPRGEIGAVEGGEQDVAEPFSSVLPGRGPPDDQGDRRIPRGEVANLFGTLDRVKARLLDQQIQHPDGLIEFRVLPCGGSGGAHAP